jgi:primosomal protein N' (replication factor Y)
VTEGKPLALRRQKSKTSTRARKFALVAEVIVESKVFHLVDPFTYGVPDDLREIISVGSQVRVPFQDQLLDGLVVKIRSGVDLSVKPIQSVAKTVPLGEEFIEFIQLVSDRYATRLSELLRFVPQIPITQPPPSNPTKLRARRITYLMCATDPYERAAAVLSQSPGRILVTVPTDREVSHLVTLCSKANLPVYQLSSSGSMSERRLALQSAYSTDRFILIGTVGAILTPVEFDQIIVLGESSPHYWQARAPYWNLRDVALIRASATSCELIFIGVSPSLEISRLIDTGFITLRTEASSLRTRRFSFEPESYHRAIREGLKLGPVLISVIDKTYSNAFVCSKCRNRPRCHCGGRLTIVENEKVKCDLCNEIRSNWSCAECSNRSKYLLRRGAARVKEELGKAFPNVPIYLATAESRTPKSEPGSITIATPGMEPLEQRYGAVILLDGEGALHRYGLRSEEFLREYWLRLVCRAHEEAAIDLSLPREHRISQMLQIGNPRRAIANELQEREEVALPPWRRIICIGGMDSDLNSLRLELVQEFPGAIISEVFNSKLVIRIAHDDAPRFAKSIFALARYRSATRRKPMQILFDPFDI